MAYWTGGFDEFVIFMTYKFGLGVLVIQTNKTCLHIDKCSLNDGYKILFPFSFLTFQIGDERLRKNVPDLRDE